MDSVSSSTLISLQASQLLLPVSGNRKLLGAPSHACHRHANGHSH